MRRWEGREMRRCEYEEEVTEGEVGGGYRAVGSLLLAPPALDGRDALPRLLRLLGLLQGEGGREWRAGGSKLRRTRGAIRL